MDFKDSSLSYVERWDSTWQMMRNYQKNMRMFISDQTGGFGSKMGVAESENGRKRGRLYGHI